jgi:hypothetical protein
VNDVEKQKNLVHGHACRSDQENNPWERRGADQFEFARWAQRPRLNHENFPEISIYRLQASYARDRTLSAGSGEAVSGECR